MTDGDFLTPQWFVDHPAPDWGDRTSVSTWQVITAPERRDVTQRVIRQARRELRAMERQLSIEFNRRRHRLHSPRTAIDAAEEMPRLAEKVHEARAIYKALTETEQRLGRIHEDISRRWVKGVSF